MDTNRPTASPGSARDRDPAPPPEGHGVGLLHPRGFPGEEASEHPDRYAVREDERGRYLACLEAPEVKVRVERDLSVTAAAARKAPEGTIYLDGAAQGEPFLDLERRVLNLDHHEGCVRPFTLATCEQALVLVLKGLDLRERPWTLLANEPDLDTLLALWVLLNALHLREERSPVRRRAIPLVRLEGAIDVHGLELQELSGLSSEGLRQSRETLDALHTAELELKRSGRWGRMDPLDYTVAQLRALDRLLYPRGHFAGFTGVEELARVELTRDRVAVVCRSAAGIYELERELKRLYGNRLGVVVLQKDPRTYTLRRVDPFLAGSLESAYEKLNSLDPAVGDGGASNRWGGSEEIGGSPRATGTDLAPDEIAGALRLTYRRPGALRRLGRVVLATLAGGAPVAAGVGAARLARPGVPGHPALAVATFAGLLVALVLLALAARRQPRFYGLGLPRGLDWLLLILPALLGAAFGGVWIGFPGASGGAPPGRAMVWGVALALPLLAEVSSRGVAFGFLVPAFRIQHPGGRWFLSWPVALSTLLYAAGLQVLLLPPLAAAGSSSILFGLSDPLLGTLALPGALLFGLAAGMARERSGSLLVPLALHYAGVGVFLLASRFVW